MKEKIPFCYESPKQVRTLLLSMAEPGYRDFAASLLPGETRVLGVRLPKLRALAKELAKNGGLQWLSHQEDCWFEETMLRGMVIGSLKEEPETVFALCRDFLPRIQNWSVCDSFCSSLKLTAKVPQLGWEFLFPLAHSPKEFEARVAAVLLLNYYLTPDWIDRALDLLCQIRQPDYYAKMAVAWAFSKAWLVSPEKTRPYFVHGALNEETRKMAFQKVRDSHRPKEPLPEA